MNSRLNTIRALAVILAFGPLAANAAPPEPTYWANNGHYYQVIAHDSISWDDANALAAGMTYPLGPTGATGHLATLTTLEEDAFVEQLRLAALTGPDAVLTKGQVWIGGLQVGSDEPGGGWGWVNSEGPFPGTNDGSPYANWADAEPNNSGGPSINERHLTLGRYTGVHGWNDEGSAPASIGGYVVEFDLTSEAVVEVGDNQLIFNQANVPGSDNPLTAAYQEVLTGGGVSIDCCTVLDTREGAGPAKHGYFKRTFFDLGVAMRNVAEQNGNPSCKDMPEVANGKAILAPWLRSIPRPGDSSPRKYDIGVCVIQSSVLSKGVVFSEEDARNVLGYAIDCSAPNVSDRPFTGGVAIDPKEIDAPFVTPWTAECDESRSAKKYSNNLMALNLRHDKAILSSKLYVSGLALSTTASIFAEKLKQCVDNSYPGFPFLNNLLSLVKGATADILRGSGAAAVAKLDNATRLALLLDSSPLMPPPLLQPEPLPPEPYDPYGTCADNPKGLFVGRLMSLKMAACSEIQNSQAVVGAAQANLGNCAIADDILAALPHLPTFDEED